MVPYTEEELNRINRRRKIINKEVSSSTNAARFIAVFFTIILLLFLIISLENDSEQKKKTEKYGYSYKKRKEGGRLGLLIGGIVMVYTIIFSIVRKVYIGSSGISVDDMNFHFKINSEIINKYLKNKGNFNHSRFGVAISNNDLNLVLKKKYSDYLLTGEDLINGEYKQRPVSFSEVLIKKEESNFNPLALRWETEEVLLFDGVYIKITFEKPFIENMAFAIGKTKYLDITYPKLYQLNLGKHMINCMCHNEIVGKDLAELVLSAPLTKLFDRFGQNIKVVFSNNIIYIVHTEYDDKFTIKNTEDISQSQISKVHRDIDLYFEILDMLELESNIWASMTSSV